MLNRILIMLCSSVVLLPFFSEAISYTYTSTFSNQTSTSSSSSDGRSSVSVQQNISAHSSSEVTASDNETVSTSTQQSNEIHIEAHSDETTQSGSNGTNGKDGTDVTSGVAASILAHLGHDDALPHPSPTPVTKPFIPKPTSTDRPSIPTQEVVLPSATTSSNTSTNTQTKEEIIKTLKNLLSANPKVTHISLPVGNEAISIETPVPAKLFGLFKTHIRLHATVETTGQIKIRLPWYALFFKI